MNNKGIQLFLEKAGIGDAISVRSSRYEELTYVGVVQEITKKSVWIKSAMSLTFFESLIVPPLEEFQLSELWWCAITKPDGQVIHI